MKGTEDWNVTVMPNVPHWVTVVLIILFGKNCDLYKNVFANLKLI